MVYKRRSLFPTALSSTPTWLSYLQIMAASVSMWPSLEHVVTVVAVVEQILPEPDLLTEVPPRHGVETFFILSCSLSFPSHILASHLIDYAFASSSVKCSCYPFVGAVCSVRGFVWLRLVCRLICQLEFGGESAVLSWVEYPPRLPVADLEVKDGSSKSPGSKKWRLKNSLWLKSN